MRLLFHYYVGKLSSPIDDPYERISTEGLIDLFDWLVENKIVDGVVVRIDDFKPSLQRIIRPSGVVVEFTGEWHGFVPEPGDVVWVRGGWKRQWTQWLQMVEARGNWLIYYDANTGHWRWPYWHVMLRDIEYKTELRQPGRRNPLQLWVHYPKPMSRIFEYRPGTEIKWDICINASHIYDRKGQWIAYRALMEYEKIYGEKLRVVIPGAIRYSGEKTRQMLEDAALRENYAFVNFVKRDVLAQIMNSSRLFLATSCGGYGDRSGTEAGLCGCPLVVFHKRGSYNYHAPYVFENSEISVCIDDFFSPPEHYDFAGIARVIHEQLQTADDRRPKVAAWFKQKISVETGSGPVLKKLCNFFRRHPVADRALLPQLMEEMTA